jgi:hypothetical protein
MGLDPQKSLTQMHKDSYMSYRIWVEMMEMETIEIEKAMKKVGGREGQSPSTKCRKSTISSTFS